MTLSNEIQPQTQIQPIKNKTSIEMMKKMNKIMELLKNCDKRYIIHEFVNQSPQKEMELMFESRSETTGRNIN